MFFVVVSLIIFYVIAIFMPKRISWFDIWTTTLFTLVIETFSDMTLDLKLNLYGYIAPGVQWSGFIPIFLYPPINAIFLNYYLHQKTKFRIGLYFLAWIAFCLIYEIAILESGVFYYGNWKFWYSALCYPVLLYAVIWNYKFTRWLLRRAF